MHYLKKEDRWKVRNIFSGHHQWRVFIDCVLEGGYGHALSDLAGNPRAAVLFFSGAVIYGGDPQYGKDLCHSFPVQPLVMAENKEWHKLLELEFKNRINYLTRYLSPYSSWDSNHLINSRIGWDYSIRRATETDLEILSLELGWEHQNYHFSSPADFLERGLAYVAVRGEKICAGISCFARWGNRAEISVETLPEHRRLGLATALGKAFLRECAAQGIEANWDAANPESRDLAGKLGYRTAQEYQVLSITE